MISIKNKSFVKINKDESSYFGGDQSWWKNADNLMSDRGCGVISMCNLELYLNGGTNKGISYEDYRNYVEKRYCEAYPMPKKKKLRKLGLLPTTMEKGLDDYFQSKNIDPIISWGPTVSKRRIRKFMDKMLENNIPIVASYYVFNKKHKLDLYTYDEKTECLHKEAKIGSHYFNIVGITSRENRDLLIISTWGTKYYAYFDEWVKKLSIFTNILYVEE